MPMRITGMNSGMDTESMVQELVRVSSTGRDKLKKAQTKLEWKQDAWKDLNTKVYSFFNTKLNNLRFESAFTKKKTTVADSSIASVIAGDSAVNGTQTLAVKQLAKSGYLTGGKLARTNKLGDGTLDTSKVTSKTTLKDLGVSVPAGSTIDIKVKADKDAQEKTITLSETSTVGDFIGALKDAGVSASFDETNQRIFVSASGSGAAKDFSITAGNMGGLEALNSLKLLTAKDAEKFKDSIVTVPAANPIVPYDQPEPKRDDFATDDDFDIANDAYKAAKKAHEDAETARFNKEKDAYDAYQTQFNRADKLQSDLEAAKGSASAAVRIDGTDAEILLNGALFTSDTNSFSINGLTITANSVSATDAKGDFITTTINTVDDNEGIYDMIKGFFKDYNDLIKELDTKYNAESSKGYEPLTDDEKDEMNDTEIEQWEKKIKDSLLRRDGDLGTLINTLKTSMLSTFTVNGKKMSLANFGISTQGYFAAGENEKGVYHIDGDKDDETSSANTDALKAMIASDPEAVKSFFTQLVGGLYTKVNGLMQRTDYRSIYKVYDDKRLKTEYDDYKSKITKAEEKLTALEDRYYDQFASMEKALSKINSQSTYISSLFAQ